jgi:hypothetical protein
MMLHNENSLGLGRLGTLEALDHSRDGKDVRHTRPGYHTISDGWRDTSGPQADPRRALTRSLRSNGRG